MFNGPDTNADIHIFTAADPEIERMVEFRDRLRKDDDDRELYAAVKATVGATTLASYPALRRRQVGRNRANPPVGA